MGKVTKKAAKAAATANPAGDEQRELARDDVLAILRRENPRVAPHDIVIYADAFLSYREAMANIDRNGTIVAHPRTGAPIENPYLKVRDAASRTIRASKRIKTGDLWD